MQMFHCISNIAGSYPRQKYPQMGFNESNGAMTQMHAFSLPCYHSLLGNKQLSFILKGSSRIVVWIFDTFDNN